MAISAGALIIGRNPNGEATGMADQEPLGSDYLLHEEIGRSAFAVVRRATRRTGGAQVAAALSTAHAQGLRHLDLTPETVLTVRASEPLGVRVAGFGVATLLLNAGRSVPGGPSGHTAPEAGRSEPPTAAAGVYSLGVLIVEMLTGIPPAPRRRRRSAPACRGSSSDSPSRVAPTIPTSGRRRGDHRQDHQPWRERQGDRGGPDQPVHARHRRNAKVAGSWIVLPDDGAGPRR
jgi:Protein kinase domain